MSNTAWAPLASTHEGLLNAILSLCDETDVEARENAVESLAISARRIHKFWVNERWNDLHSDNTVDVVINVASAITMAEANRILGTKQWLH